MTNRRQVWIRFDESDRRTPAPQFELETHTGRRVALSDFRGRQNLVLYFAPAKGSDARITHDLDAFIRREPDYRFHGTQVLAFLPDDPQLMGGLASALLDREKSSLLILLDPSSATRKEYAALLDASLVSDQDSLLYILDQFGAPYAAQAAGLWDQFDRHSEILDWLDFIGMLCPE
jgi:peroxiredoxin